MRYLAAHGIFKEVTPNVFANNMLSSLLNRGVDVKTLREKYVYLELDIPVAIAGD